MFKPTDKELEKLGFNIDKLSKEELEDLRQCHITISESEDWISSNNMRYGNHFDNASLQSSVEIVPQKIVNNNSSKGKFYKAEDSSVNNDNSNNNNLKHRTSKSKVNSNIKQINNYSNNDNSHKKINNNNNNNNNNQSPYNCNSNIRNNISSNNNNNKSNNKPSNNNISNQKYISPSDNLSNVILEKEDYIKLKNLPPKQLSVKDLVAIKIYERFDILNKEYNETKQLYFQHRQEKLTLEEENSMLKMEKEKQQVIHRSTVETLNIKLSSHESENIKLKELVKSQEKQLKESYPKVNNYEELSQENRKLLKLLEEENEKNSTLTNTNSTITKEKQDLLRKNENQRFEIESLNRDKAYLTKEALHKDDKIISLTEKTKSLEEEVINIRKTNDKYVEKLTDKSSFIENMYQEKLKDEISEIKIKYNNDLEHLKKVYEELNTTRTNYLIEERNDLKLKLGKLESELKEKTSSNDFLHEEMRNSRTNNLEETSNLKIQLKIKSEDYDRIVILYEENLNLIRVIKAENEGLKEKYDIFRNELINKEAMYREELANLKAENVVLKESNASYDRMEKEIDGIIVDSSMNELDKDIKDLISNIPTSSKRRINQCLALAQKLKESILEKERILNENNTLKNSNVKLNEEKEILKDIVERCKQPYSYLVKRIEELEYELIDYKNQNNNKDSYLNSLQRDKDLLEQKVDNLLKDLESVLGNRKKLDNIESLIVSFSGLKTIHKSNFNQEANINNNSMNYSNNDFRDKNLNMTSKDSYPIANHNNNMLSQSQCNNYNKNINMNTNSNSLANTQCSNMNNNMNSNMNYNSNSITNTNNNALNKESIPQWYINLKMKNSSLKN